MSARQVFPEQAEFSIFEPENFFLIENHPDEVVIRAARDNLSLPGRASFVRYLAAEGYIPERFEWFDEAAFECAWGLRWVVDCSWMDRPAGAERKALRRILLLVLSAGLFLLGMLSSILLYAPH